MALATFSDALPPSMGRSSTPPSDALRTALRTLRAVVAELAPERLGGEGSLELYELLALLERTAGSGRTLLAPHIEASGVWRQRGHRSPAGLLSSLDGGSEGQARGIIVVGHRLEGLPATEEAVRRGGLSGPKLAALTDIAAIDPSLEEELLAGAEEAPLRAVRERCNRARATTRAGDPEAAVRRVRSARHFTSWTDVDGAFCFEGRDTADRGAVILRRLGELTEVLRKAEREGRPARPRPEAGARAVGEEPVEGTPERALRADAFFALLTGQLPEGVPPPRGADDTVRERPPTRTVLVRVDLEALRRGTAEPGEVCEIDGQGPIPVAMARDLMSDSFLQLVFHRAGDIRAVSHQGRTINRRLRTALAFRDGSCVVPGCGVGHGLEIDHVVPFAEGGPTELENLALLCHHHHFLKTYEGWTLSHRSDGSWTFLPQPAFGSEPEFSDELPPWPRGTDPPP